VNLFRSIYLSARFFYLLSGIILWFCFAFILPFLFLPGLLLLSGLCMLLLADLVLLYGKKQMLSGQRTVPPRLSLSDENRIGVQLSNLGKQHLTFELVDELPVQLQVRDFSIKGTLTANGTRHLHYSIRPLSRGAYSFGEMNVFLMSRLKLMQRRIRLPLEQTVPVYPSIVQMKNFELFTMSSIARVHGIKKMRRIGHSYTFEQIKPYVRGDDVRQINWRSSARHQQLMINQFEDEKSQQVYNIIDKSRNMLMPFNGLSLLDYAINTALVISNVALRRQDMAGLITFSDKIGSVLRADRKHGQLQAILDALYNQKERDLEASYEHLYFAIRQLIKTRSLIFLYTNFESMYGLKRVLPVLQKINMQHLLTVVFFENSELEALSRSPAKDLKDVYTRILAEQALNDKAAIAHELNNMGIQTILSRPEDLNMNTINKYLEIKSRGMI
jgi:uncharacterized protein (DUF58 family)